jgi:hypothetical protein
MNNYVYVLMVMVLTLCCVTCNTKRHVPFSERLIKNISEEDQNNPSSFYNFQFFCKCQDNKILPLNIYEIREVYLKEFSHIDYQDFLTDLLNQRIDIQCKNHNEKFTINETVQKLYKEKNLNDFINFYCSEKSNNLFWQKNNIPDNQRNTILYFLFVNNYLTSIDDYSGAFVIRKME